jgi:hypothetical protein
MANILVAVIQMELEFKRSVPSQVLQASLALTWAASTCLHAVP